MTKNVIVKIEGYQSGTAGSIKTQTPGIYQEIDGIHHIQYNEKVQGSKLISKNTIKIGKSQVTLSKRVRESSQMVFDLEKITQTTYPTPYGNLTFDIKTSSIMLDETPEKIDLVLEYSLSAEGNHVSDNKTVITILAK